MDITNITKTATRILTSIVALGALTACVPDPNDPTSWNRNPARTQTVVRHEATTIIFCGIHPDDPQAQRKANAIARQAGGDVMMGACLEPDWSVYTVSEPGQRYMNREQYLRAMVINANAGMKTIVYDAAIWSTDPAVRNQAIEFWRPHTAWLWAFDMGDEADPAGADWQTMIDRWAIIDEYVTPELGVGAFTNHLGIDAVLAQAMIDFSSHKVLMSFDAYGRTNGVPQLSLDLARKYDSQTNNLVCAINALTHAHFKPNATEIRNDMLMHRDAGCDLFLIFGGVAPYKQDLSPDPYFGGSSLVRYNGSVTTWAKAVLDGAK